MAFNPELGSSSPEVLLDNAKRLDELTNGPAATVPDRAGEPLDSWRKIQEDNAALVDETRQNLIPLGRQYMTFADAQADIANIPEGSSTYYRSPDDLRLAIEVMNISGTLEPTGRVMVSKLYIDEIKNRTPNIDRSSYWGGIIAADGTIGVTFRKSDNEPILGKYGALSALTSSLTPFTDIASGMATVNINSSFLVVANGTDGLSVPTIFNKITSTMFVKLFAVTTDEQVADIGRRSGYWGGIVAKNGLVGMVFRESDNRPIFGGGGERGGDIFSRLEAVENSGGIVIKKSHTAGDSTGAGTGAPAGYSFPDQLAALIGDGFVATNYSIGGQKSGQVAMRMGAKPIYLTVNGDLIPASGGSVAITQINGISATAEPQYPSQDVRFLSTPSNTTTYTLDGWISGIKCRVTRTSSGGVETYNLTALSGAGFRCLPGSLFVPEYAMQDHSDSEMWICVGINDFRSGATTAADYDADVAAIKTNIDALVNQAEKSGRPILVYGINTCNYPPVELLGGIRYQRIIEVNQYLSQKYPGYYVRGGNGRDLREELVSRYNASIAQDVTDFGNDIVPSSLRSDPRHPNATGYGVYAELGYQTRQRRG
ncbi:flagellar biosynthesis, cell-distal portion of basal-body rod [Klebsiella quasipneumoniae]|uniref:hypothetical protein n=1 Tax=Klebsiella quasipneumoniae TaxID=1463165 RepID=UPI00125543F2|nr:hypothetical protein [Klebsiella quasipneumoniae]VAS52435.1 flagellar biosynthesis, cell-distal portion of basal-body rod [Klebsiella quasipneumoniae]